MTPEAHALFIGACIKVVALDGSVWWTLPQNAASFEALEHTTEQNPPDDGFKLYWQNQKVKAI